MNQDDMNDHDMMRAEVAAAWDAIESAPVWIQRVGSSVSLVREKHGTRVFKIVGQPSVVTVENGRMTTVVDVCDVRTGEVFEAEASDVEPIDALSALGCQGE